MKMTMTMIKTMTMILINDRFRHLSLCDLYVGPKRHRSLGHKIMTTAALMSSANKIFF